MTALDFELWGREAAQNYLTHNIPLNKTITKIAKQNKLNYDQIHRVVEEANNTTYVRKFANFQSPDKYIEFEVADAKTVRDNLNIKLELPSSDDYLKRPKEDFSLKMSRATPIKKEEPSKTAAIYRAKGIYDRFETHMNRLSLEFQEKTAQLLNYPDAGPALRSLVKDEYEPNSTEAKLAMHILSSLSDKKENRIPNPNSKPARLLKEAVALGIEYSKSYNEGPDMSSIEKVASVTDALFKLLVAAGLVGAGAALGHKQGYEKGKRTQAIMMSPLQIGAAV